MKMVKKREVSGGIFPVYMQVENETCLVVGGGKVARRKVKKLADCGACVILIAPECTPALRGLAESGRIEIKERKFRNSDIQDNLRLVFAATDDFSVNKTIVELCNKRGIPVCAIDSNWHDGTFITPASFSEHGLTVSVATGGRSCRRSKLIKKNLQKHLASLNGSDLFVIGVDHNTLSLEEREMIHPAAEELSKLKAMIHALRPVHEFMILNTCNRFEVIAVAENNSVAPEMLIKLIGRGIVEESSFYVRSGIAAFTHLSLLFSGVLSQNIGETYIAAQIKETLTEAVKEGNADGIMKDWCGKSLHIAKKIRNKVLSAGAPEVEELMLDFLRKNGGVCGKTVAILGTGKIGTAVFNVFAAEKPSLIKWCYRTGKPQLSPGVKTEFYSIDNLEEALKGCDIAVAALKADKPVIKAEVLRDPRFRGCTFIDLGVPRNIEVPAENADITIINLNQLQDRVSDRQRNEIHKKASDIVGRHSELYDKIMESLK